MALLGLWEHNTLLVLLEAPTVPQDALSTHGRQSRRAAFPWVVRMFQWKSRRSACTYSFAGPFVETTVQRQTLEGPRPESFQNVVEMI